MLFKHLCCFLSVVGVRCVDVFDIGNIVIVQKLKPQRDVQLDAIVIQMNNSWVRIIDRENVPGGRHEYTIRLLEDPLIQLRVPRKKLRAFSKLFIHDYSQSSLHSMNRKFWELIDQNYVMIPSMFQRMKENHWPQKGPNVLFQRRLNVFSLSGVVLKRALDSIYYSVPKELAASMLKSLLQWTQHSEDPYLLQLFDLNWGSLDQWDTVNDCDKNTLFLKRMLNIYRINQGIRGSKEWLLPLKKGIGHEIVRQWLELNDPRRFTKSPNVHVLWKWNDIGPGYDYVDMNISDVISTEMQGEEEEALMRRSMCHKYSQWISEAFRAHLTFEGPDSECHFNRITQQRYYETAQNVLQNLHQRSTMESVFYDILLVLSVLYTLYRFYQHITFVV